MSTEGIRRRDALVERLIESPRGAFDIFGVYLGSRLGFYAALADGQWRTAAELAAQTSTHERYAREWLEHQTVVGIVEIDDPAVAAVARRFRLPDGHAEPLVDRDSLNYVAPLAAVVEAYRIDTLRRYAEEAGFRSVEVLPIDNFFFRFYRLHA